eukprot:TRINITY_DN14947_c0_g1_i1.p1 TRINITY_DN14947_c0_g1~~TRINITY_DN14947_c0_g1_i1.p1  ORF type:complete len:183 (+),score=17.92 TRINITY_DN14947_c0_g1_i1:84-632(+)
MQRVGPAWSGLRTFPVSVYFRDFVSGRTLGSGIRVSECAGVRRLYFSGNSNITDSVVLKTSLNAEQRVPIHKIVSGTEEEANILKQHEMALIISSFGKESLHQLLPSGCNGDNLPSSLLLVFLNEFHNADSDVDDLLQTHSNIHVVSPTLLATTASTPLKLNVNSRIAIATYEAALRYASVS